jgi:hypothetical protein
MARLPQNGKILFEGINISILITQNMNVPTPQIIAES